MLYVLYSVTKEKAVIYISDVKHGTSFSKSHMVLNSLVWSEVFWWIFLFANHNFFNFWRLSFWTITLEGVSETHFVDLCHKNSRLRYSFLLRTPLKYALRYDILKCCRNSSWTAWSFELGATGCPGTSVRTCLSAPRDIPERRRCRK